MVVVLRGASTRGMATEPLAFSRGSCSSVRLPGSPVPGCQEPGMHARKGSRHVGARVMSYGAASDLTRDLTSTSSCPMLRQLGRWCGRSYGGEPVSTGVQNRRSACPGEPADGREGDRGPSLSDTHVDDREEDFRTRAQIPAHPRARTSRALASSGGTTTACRSSRRGPRSSPSSTS